MLIDIMKIAGSYIAINFCESGIDGDISGSESNILDDALPQLTTTSATFAACNTLRSNQCLPITSINSAAPAAAALAALTASTVFFQQTLTGLQTAAQIAVAIAIVSVLAIAIKLMRSMIT